MRSKFHYLILILPFIFFVCVAWKWSKAEHKGLTGDEPHYLIIAKSIIDDFDLDVKNNYEYEAAHSEIIGPTDRHATPHNDKEYSVHLFGLPILLSLPFYFFGITGAKIFMCLVSGIVALLAYRIFLPKLSNEIISSWAAATFCISLPFLLAAQQIYSEILTGLICCWSIVMLYKLIDEQEIRFVARLIWMVSLSFLMFVHIKNILVVFLICLIYLTLCLVRLRTRRSTIKNAIQQCSLLVIPLLSVIVLATYLRTTVGSYFGSPYHSNPLTFGLHENLRVFLAFHFDQVSGLFLQNPFILVGLLGLIPLFIESKIKGIVYLSIYLPVMLLNSLVLGFFDDSGFLSSRFMWAPAILWLIPLSYGLKYIKENYAPEVINTIFIFCLLFQLNNFIYWISIDPIRINWEGRFFTYYNAIESYLPSFKPDLLNTSVNTLYLLGFLLLILHGSPSNWPIRKALRPVWTIYFVVFSILIVVVIQPKNRLIKDIHLGYKNMSAPMGQLIVLGNEEFWQCEDKKEGMVWFGPYMPLNKGVYELTYFIETKAMIPDFNGPLVTIDVSSNAGRAVLSSKTITTTDNNSKQFKLSFELKEYTSLLEFRIFKHANSSIRIKEILVQNVDSN
jgi:hypothetical protein